MPNSEIISDIKKIALYTLIGVIIMIGLFAVFGHFSLGVVIGGFLGGVTAVLNLFLLAVTIENSYGREGKGSQTLMGLSYLGRIALIAGVVIFAIKSQHINYLAAIIPLIFPQIIIKIFYSVKTISEEKKKSEH